MVEGVKAAVLAIHVAVLRVVQQTRVGGCLVLFHML